jgi:hypothetical protein
VLALGHTADDCAEALRRNVLFNGRIASLPPVARSRKGELRLIRPLAFVTEALTIVYGQGSASAPSAAYAATRRAHAGRSARSSPACAQATPRGVGAITAALADVDPYTLFDPGLTEPGANLSRAFSDEP